MHPHHITQQNIPHASVADMAYPAARIDVTWNGQTIRVLIDPTGTAQLPEGATLAPGTLALVERHAQARLIQALTERYAMVRWRRAGGVA